MVEVIKGDVSGEAINQMPNPMAIFGWLGQHVVLIIFALLLVGMAIILFIILKKFEDERKARDDPIYEYYKNVVIACQGQADQNRIINNYSLKNILVFGLPIFRNEHSARILDYTNRLLGFYRGHFISQDGNLNFLVYKNKSFGIMEQRFVIRCPIQINLKTSNNQKNSNIIDLKSFIGEYANGDYKINCCSVEKVSYFWVPVFIDNDMKPIDLRSKLNKSIVDIGYSQMVSRVLALGSKQVEKAMLHNPNLKFKQMEPEKTKAESNNDED